MTRVKTFLVCLEIHIIFVIFCCVVSSLSARTTNKRFPGINKDKGNVFKPQPLQSGPWVKMTRGEIWPKPKYQEIDSSYLLLNAGSFKVDLSDNAKRCEILVKSILRFEGRIFPGAEIHKKPPYISFDYKDLEQASPSFRGVLEELHIELLNTAGCEPYPSLEMDETYELDIPIGTRAHLRAQTVWGILRGLESFTQLVYNVKEHGSLYQINSTYIKDGPRFSHRGVMLDTSRHYLSKRSILSNLNLMEMNKMNVFHWHMTDDTSFPYQSTRFPDLSKHGAFDPVTHVYTPEDVKEIIEEARIRGIRVIPEFGTPGHTKSWEPGQPGLLVQCEDRDGNPLNVFGPMDPTNAKTYEFLGEFFTEIAQVFPDHYVHNGGDEVVVNEHTNCWLSNRRIKDIMNEWNIAGDYKRLEGIFMEQLMQKFKSIPISKGHIFWQESFDNGIDLDKNNSIIEVWKDWGKGWKAETKSVTQNGYKVILAAPWYLNYIKYGSDWAKFYKINPTDFSGTEEDKKLVVGGEVCLWGEFVNSNNMIPRLWPRASAAAEVLWSPDQFEDSSQEQVLKDAAKRLQEHECRMMGRGYPVQPVVGAGYCPVHWNF